MNSVTVTKLHGLGNDFLVLLDDVGAPGLPESGPDLARRACDRHWGIGADGLVWGRSLPGPGGPHAPQLSFTLWNADGGEAEMSGNGMRCLAHAALEAGWVGEGQPFGVLTPVGRREVNIRRRPEPETTWASVEMGPVKVTGEADRCNVGHGQLLVDVGNPHLVVLGRHPEVVDVPGLGRQLSATDPAGLNVEFVALGPGPEELTMRVWERGVGETQACGTGACAAAVAMHHWGRVGPNVTVHQPGGSVAVGIHPDGTVTLSGPSQRVAVCSFLVAGVA